MDIHDDEEEIKKVDAIAVEENNLKSKKSTLKVNKTSQVIHPKNKNKKSSESFQKSPKSVNKFKMSFE
jgi:hypothetical protein